MVADSHYVNCSFLAVKYYEMARWRPIFVLRKNIGEDPDTAMATPLMNYRAVHSSMEILPPSFDEGTKDGFLLIGLGD